MTAPIAQPAGAARGGPPAWFLAGAALAAFATLIALGVWQLDRRAWKAEIIARQEAARAAPPLTALPSPATDPLSLEYRSIRLVGTFQHDRELFVPGREWRSRAGFHVLTPFALADGGVVMVNRGFVIPERQSAPSRAAGQIAGETVVTGVIRRPLPGNWLTPDNRPDLNLWFTHDLAAMAQAVGASTLPPFVIEADATPNPGGWPVGGQTRFNLPNNHLQYALTWFSLAATMAVVLGIAWRRRRTEVAG